tara:strand:+ start:490 stop:690 length:201 start_codon:yes stop_codon:yes gene_type:complete
MKPGNLVKMESPYFGCKEGVGLVMKVSNHFEYIVGGFPRSVVYVTVKWNGDITTIEEDDQLVEVNK